MAFIALFKGLVFFFYPYDVIHGERPHVHVAKGKKGHYAAGKIFTDTMEWDYTGNLTASDMRNAECGKLFNKRRDGNRK